MSDSEGDDDILDITAGLAPSAAYIPPPAPVNVAVPHHEEQNLAFSPPPASIPPQAASATHTSTVTAFNPFEDDDTSSAQTVGTTTANPFFDFASLATVAEPTSRNTPGSVYRPPVDAEPDYVNVPVKPGRIVVSAPSSVLPPVLPQRAPAQPQSKPGSESDYANAGTPGTSVNTSSIKPTHVYVMPLVYACSCMHIHSCSTEPCLLTLQTRWMSST
jgi:hypothetical protein